MNKDCKDLLDYLIVHHPTTIGDLLLAEKLSALSDVMELMRKQLTVARRVVIHSHTRAPTGVYNPEFKLS